MYRFFVRLNPGASPPVGLPAAGRTGLCRKSGAYDTPSASGRLRVSSFRPVENESREMPDVRCKSGEFPLRGVSISCSRGKALTGEWSVSVIRLLSWCDADVLSMAQVFRQSVCSYPTIKKARLSESTVQATTAGVRCVIRYSGLRYAVQSP